MLNEYLKNLDRWIELADDFMMVNFGIIDRHYAMGHRPGMAL